MQTNTADDNTNNTFGAKECGCAGLVFFLLSAWVFVGFDSIYDFLLFAAVGFAIGSCYQVLKNYEHVRVRAIIFSNVCLVAGWVLYGLDSILFFLGYISLGVFIACFPLIWKGQKKS